MSMKEIKCEGCQHLFRVSNTDVSAVSMLRARNKEAVALKTEKYRAHNWVLVQAVHTPALHILSKTKGSSLQNSDKKQLCRST